MSTKKPPEADDHWRRLAAELGLDLEPPEAEERAETVAEAADAAGPPPTAETETPVEEFVAATPKAEWPAEQDVFVAPGPTESDFLYEATAAAVEAEAPPAVSEPPTAETPVEEEKPRRRRRRSRRKKEAPAVDSEGPAVEPEAAEIEDSPAEVVKDWNIPSWNELIASLYRPER